jgi:RNA polymerase sigma-70 factor (ECF subfamily)
VDALEPDLRAGVHLHYYQGLTLQESAEALGVSVSTVKYRIRAALDALKAALEARQSAAPLSNTRTP